MRSLTIILGSLLIAGSGKAVEPPSAGKLSSYNIAGLRINLPSKPQVLNIPLPPEAKKMVISTETHKIKDKDGNTEILIVRAALKREINIKDSTDSGIARMRANPDGIGFTSAKSRVVVAGLQGYQVQASYESIRSKKSVLHFGLNFARKNVLWQVQVFGDATYRDSLRTLKEKIFSSVKLSKP